LRGKARFFDNPFMIVDKAHNLYLQTAINTGIISSAAQLTLFGIFLFWAVKKIVSAKKINTPCFAALFGSTVGVAGYMVTAFSTDSIVSVAPIFWAILGLGYACVYAADKGFD
jgi:O-antigen ligase